MLSNPKTAQLQKGVWPPRRPLQKDVESKEIAKKWL